MSTKALKRELAAAIAMLLVAMIALSGSTYAWFASNNKVEAQNMSVTAMSDAAFLEITTSASAFTGNSVTSAAFNAGSTATDSALYPGTPYKLNALTSAGAIDKTALYIADGKSSIADSVEWHYTYSDDVAVSDKGAAQAWKTVGATSMHAIEETALINEFYFRMSVNETTGSKLKATAATLTNVEAGHEIDNAVSILLAGPNGYQLITNGGSTIETFALDGTKDTTGTVALADTVGYVADSAQTTAVKVKVYVYYEGSHANVTTNDLANIVGRTVSTIEFKVNE